MRASGSRGALTIISKTPDVGRGPGQTLLAASKGTKPYDTSILGLSPQDSETTIPHCLSCRLQTLIEAALGSCSHHRIDVSDLLTPHSTPVCLIGTGHPSPQE